MRSGTLSSGKRTTQTAWERYDMLTPDRSDQIRSDQIRSPLWDLDLAIKVDPWFVVSARSIDQVCGVVSVCKGSCERVLQGGGVFMVQSLHNIVWAVLGEIHCDFMRRFGSCRRRRLLRS